jgi:hypothetical protein
MTDQTYLSDSAGRLAIQASGYFYETRRQAQAAVDPVNNTELDFSGAKVNAEFADAAQSAIEQYTATDEGKDLIAKARGMSQPEIIAALEQMIQHDVFDKVAQYAKDGKVMEDVPDTHVGCLYVSVGLQLDVGFGVAGSVTYAMDPNLRGTKDAFYALSVGGTLAIGPEIDIEVTLEVGAASSTPDEMNGLGVGLTLSAADVVGVSGAFMFGVQIAGGAVVPDLGNWSVGIGPAFGEGIGGAALVGYSIVVMDRDVPAIAQPAADYILGLVDVYCDEAIDLNGTDEVFVDFGLDYQQDPIWKYPTWGEYSVDEDAHWKPYLALNVNEHLSLSVKDSEIDAGNIEATQMIFNTQLDLAPNGSGGVRVTLPDDKKADHQTMTGVDGSDPANLKVREAFKITYDNTTLLNEVKYSLEFVRLK